MFFTYFYILFIKNTKISLSAIDNFSKKVADSFTVLTILLTPLTFIFNLWQKFVLKFFLNDFTDEEIDYCVDKRTPINVDGVGEIQHLGACLVGGVGGKEHGHDLGQAINVIRVHNLNVRRPSDKMA